MEQGFLSIPRNLSKEFRRYLLSAFSGNIAIPIYALFVPLLAARLGASLFEIGIVGGASNAVYSFLPFVTGHFSDRKGSRAFFILSSFGILVGVSISYVLISNALYLIIARIFEGVGWAILWPAMDAAVSRDVDPTVDPKKVFSIYNVTWSGAAAVGPLLGSFLIFLTSIRVAFLFTLFLMGTTFVLNLIPWLKNDVPEKNNSPASIDMNNTVEMSSLALDSAPKLGSGFYGGACALAAVSSGVLFTFFAPYSRSLGISILLVGVITFVYGFGRFLFYVLTTNEGVRYKILRPDRRARNMLTALVMTSAASLLISFHDPSGLSYLLAYAIVGVGISIVFAISQAGLIVESSQGRFGRGAGIFESSIGVGACAGPIIGGAISGSSLSVPFIVPFLGFLVFLAAFPVLTRRRTNRPV